MASAGRHAPEAVGGISSDRSGSGGPARAQWRLRHRLGRRLAARRWEQQGFR